jgi:BTB/POZ domain-containing protein KCTD9
MMNFPNLILNLIYKATRDGFKAGDFHSRCDSKGPTICVIKSEHGKTFGGYKKLSWKSSGGSITGEGKSFIFQLDCNTKHNCISKEWE